MKGIMINPLIRKHPEFDRLPNFRLQPGNFMHDRLRMSIKNWLMVAPDANPAMFDMFYFRNRQPQGNLQPWSGEFAGKYLTSAVLTLRLTGDKSLRNYLEKCVKMLIASQENDGYLGPFPAERKFTATDLWDLWGHYHCMLGLLLWFQETGDRGALDACVKAANLLCQTFLGGEKRVIKTGCEEMNEAVIHILCLLYETTSQEDFLRLAREIEKDWETPPSGDYVRCSLAGKSFYECPKPRWESLHDLQGIVELYYITGDQRYRTAFESLWWSIHDGDRHNHGGFSSGERATGNPYDPAAVETCCNVAWMAVTVDMLSLTGNSLAADELELSTYNVILGAQNPTGRWWTYNTPMDGQRKASGHDIVFQARPGSPELNCCSVNGPRALGMLSEWAIMTDQEDIVLNYFGPSNSRVALPSGPKVRITLETKYPVENQIAIKLYPDNPCRFGLKIRIPNWSKDTFLDVNGETQVVPQPGSYFRLERNWTSGDTINIYLDFSLRTWVGERECKGKISIYRGPILLAYDPRFDRYDPQEVPSIDLDRSKEKLITWEHHNPPLLLVNLPTKDGREISLCDFASAGLTGTYYVSWLPE